MRNIDHIRCVRWSADGTFLATASSDMSVNLIDFRTGKIFHTEKSDSKLLFGWPD